MTITTTPTRGLTRDQVAAFDRDGCLTGLSVFSEVAAATWAEEVLALHGSGIPGHPAPWNQKTYLLLPCLDAIVRDPRLTGLVADVLGPNLLALSADVFVKPPRSPRRITWHQDVNYWELEPFDMLTAWVALTPATPENGGMQYGRGGHRGRLEHVEHPDEHNILSRGQELAVEVARADVVDVTLRPGQVSFHHALAPHASGPNTTDQHRVGFAIRYASVTVAQRGGPTISARLARGIDTHGNFPLEPGPDAPLSAAARAVHARALAPHAATGYSTV
jgi:non-haem Fe2+, alpha-ketoglutarate-dependent halogenase